MPQTLFYQEPVLASFRCTLCETPFAWKMDATPHLHLYCFEDAEGKSIRIREVRYFACPLCHGRLEYQGNQPKSTDNP